MGLLDQVLGGVLGGSGTDQSQQPAGGAQAMLVQAVLGMLMNRQSGGLAGLAGLFRQAGLGNKVDSWISTGDNVPVSGPEVQQALGSDQITALAQRAGIPPELTASVLAQILPQIVDQATPGGQIPEQGTLEQGLDLLKGRLFGG